jgi:hypothetical protein
VYPELTILKICPERQLLLEAMGCEKRGDAAGAARAEADELADARRSLQRRLSQAGHAISWDWFRVSPSRRR